MVDECQSSRPHTIDGTKVETKRATPRDDCGPGSGQTVSKIFLGGLKDGVSDENLKEYFGEFGKVVQVEQMTDKATGRKRGFGFIEFDDYDPVDKLMIRGSHHMVNGYKIDVKKAISKNDMNQGGGGGRGGRGGGGGRGGYGGVWKNLTTSETSWIIPAAAFTMNANPDNFVHYMFSTICCKIKYSASPIWTTSVLNWHRLVTNGGTPTGHPWDLETTIPSGRQQLWDSSSMYQVHQGWQVGFHLQ